jgi:DedD protein
VVLALAAAIVVPMFLESDPKPLGKDVQIDIPPVDSSRFVSRLTPKDAAPAPLAPQPPPAPAAAEAPVEPPPAHTADKAAEPPAAGAEPPAIKAAGAGAETKSAAAGPTQSAEAKPASAKPAPTPASGGENYVVQLAAYAEPATAHALERKLKMGGFPAYTETLKTSHGDQTRVRVGPYATRDAAEGQRAKLKDAGQNGMVAPLH